MKELNLEVKIGNNGVTIYGDFHIAYDCAEFTLKAGQQAILIAPWIQFAPAAMEDERLKLAIEIARRAVMHDELIKELASLQKQKRCLEDRETRIREQQHVGFDMWREERAKFGLPKDFSDIKDWPAEMKSDYV